MTFNEAYKAWRNRARGFSAISLVASTLRVLHEPAADRLEEMRKAPWNLMLLVKWACQDRMLDRVTHGVSAQEFHELRQALWEMPDQVDMHIRDTLPWRLFLRQHLSPQLAFQRRPSLGFLREAALLAAQNPIHQLRRRFEERIGIPLSNFIDMAYALAAEILNGTKVINLPWFDVFRRAYSPEVVDRFIAAISLTFDELRAFCRALPDADTKVASEYFEFTALSRYPFLRDDRSLYLWHPAVFLRGMEGFVHSVLSEAREVFIEPFSKIFERHVLGEARLLTVPFFGEAEIKRWLPPDTQVPDGLLAYGTCNVFIESKAGLFDESVMTVGHSTIFSHKTRALLTAANQAWSASELMRTGGEAPKQVLDAPIDYLLIVTNKELNAGRGPTLADIYPEGKFSPPTELAARTLPVAHIYVLSVEDFERLMAATRRGEIDLPAFLAEIVRLDADPSTMTFFLHQHLDQRGISHHTSDLVHQAMEAVHARLEPILPKGDN